MKLFGEFLVEKNIITKDALLKALIQQLQKLPPACDVVYQQNLLQVDEILKVLSLQAQKKMGFIEAARELGLWNEKIYDSVQLALISQKVPLGQILVEQGQASLDAITQALDEFLSEIEDQQPTQTQTPHPPGQSAEREFTSNPISSEPEAPSAAAVTSIDVGLIQDYAEIVNEKTRSEIVGLIDLFAKEPSDQAWTDKDPFLQLAHHLHVWAGATGFIRCENSHRLLQGCENFIRKILIRDPFVLDQNLIQIMTSTLRESLEIFWQIRKTLIDTRSEASYFDDSTRTESYQKILEKMKTLSDGAKG